MDREKEQLAFAMKHYWTLCKRLYPRVDPKTKYLNESGETTTPTRLYCMHLASCCFRIATLVERRHIRQSVYKKLKGDSNYRVDAYELSVLIRDTVGHYEGWHKKYPERRSYLSNMTIGDIHSVIGDLVSAL